jgi:hypothetical protein
MKRKLRGRYVICARAEGAEDLEVRKVYRVLADESASALGHLRATACSWNVELGA